MPVEFYVFYNYHFQLKISGSKNMLLNNTQLIINNFFLIFVPAKKKRRAWGRGQKVQAPCL
jgi:hypothetical protein